MPTREDHAFHSGVDVCAAWVFRPDDELEHPRPVVVLGHGLGDTRESGPARFAERFADSGIIAAVFDHRYVGASSGEPRGLISIPARLADWDAAIAFARMLPGADPDRIAVWGSGSDGDHVIATAARHPDLSAVVAQRPSTDGISLLRRARTALRRPGRAAARVRMPLMASLAEHGSAASAGRLEKAPRADVRIYPARPDDLDEGPVFEKVVADQTAFLVRHLRA